MFSRLKNNVNNASGNGITQKNAVIRVIGDRASGKTTYMAALARFPQSSSDKLVRSISAINDDGEELIIKAQNILEQGLEVEPTILTAKTKNLKDYQFSIVLDNQIRVKGLQSSQQVQLNISFKDYAGEFFSDLLYQDQNATLLEYIDDCSEATGIMFLMDGSSQRKDTEYAAGVEKFLKLLAQSDVASKLQRVALVLTKCEMPDLWIKRKNPEKLAKEKFKRICSKLSSWQSTTKGARVDFFTTSAFGVVGSRFPEGNFKTKN